MIYVGDAVEVLGRMATGSVHCAITSPPYWGLRNYGVDGQLGQERTPEEYIERLVEVFREVRRVLRDDGTFWLNMGDRYVDGSLVGLPWRVALSLRDDGWLLREDIIWHKPNALPASAKNRPSGVHEYVFLLAKNRGHYYYDQEAIKEPAAKSDGTVKRNKRSVWAVYVEPFPGAHFAVFPTKLVEPMVLAGTSERGCCANCGAPYERVTGVTGGADAACADGGYRGKATKDYEGAGAQDPGATKARILASMKPRETVGWEPGCNCNAGEPIPCTVLDPFGGSGTVALVAKRLGRSSVYIDIHPEYAAIARRRLVGVE